MRPLRPTTRVVVVLGVLTGGLLAGGLVASAWRGTAYSPPSAAQLLARSQEFVRRARTVRFAGDARVEESAGEAGAGSQGDTFVHRASIDGEAILSDRVHVTIVSEGEYTEVITIGEKTYVRSAEHDFALKTEKWAALDPRQADARMGITRPDPSAAAADPTDPSDPGSLFRMLQAARAPYLVRSEAGLRIVRARLDPRRAFGAAAGDVQSASVELALYDDGRLERATLEVSGSGSDTVPAAASVDYRLSRWGRPLTIEAPPPGQLDPTPGIDEEKLAGFSSAPLLQPHGIPAGWVLDGATVIPAADTEEGCDQVELDYTDPQNEDAGYLSLYELPTGCANPKAPRGSQPFRAGGAEGWVQLDQDTLTAQLTFGRTVVQVDTDLQPEDVVTVLAQLQPLDLTVTPVPIPGIGSNRGSA